MGGLRTQLLASQREASEQGEEDHYSTSLVQLINKVRALLDRPAQAVGGEEGGLGGASGEGSGQRGSRGAGAASRRGRTSEGKGEESQQQGPPLQLGGHVEL